jgi:hypothetical protein
MPFEQRPELVEVLEVVGVERLDDRSAVRRGVDEPLGLEDQERFAPASG